MPTNHRGDPIGGQPNPLRSCVHCKRESSAVDLSLKMYLCPTCTKHAPSVIERANKQAQ